MTPRFLLLILGIMLSGITIAQDFNVMRSYQAADSSRCRIAIKDDPLPACVWTGRFNQTTASATHDISDCGFSTILGIYAFAENTSTNLSAALMVRITARTATTVTTRVRMQSDVTILSISVAQWLDFADPDTKVNIFVIGR